MQYDFFLPAYALSFQHLIKYSYAYTSYLDTHSVWQPVSHIRTLNKDACALPSIKVCLVYDAKWGYVEYYTALKKGEGEEIGMEENVPVTKKCFICSHPNVLDLKAAQLLRGHAWIITQQTHSIL